ncbi:hypothetical protein LXL04_006923 [Taraxacum kok-saghyz]
MARRSFTLYIDLNGEPAEMSVSEFLTYLSTMDDDSEKVNAAVDFILNLQEELLMVTSFECRFPNCIRFLKDAIATVQKEKQKCEKRAREKEGKLHEGNSDISKGTLIISDENKDMNEGQTNSISDESFVENEMVPILLGPMVQPEDMRSDPNVVQEVNRRQRMVWSVDLHREFKFAVEALGGAREAKPKNIHGLLKVDGLTTEQIKSHLQRYRKHLISRGQLHSAIGSNHNMQNANSMLIRTRFSMLCMQPGESSNTHMTRAPNNKMN